LNDFDHLHPSLQHHVVNSLGWKSLRPVQEQCIAPILGGENILVLAPTAGGKTEAAVIPLLSRILAEGWSGLSILYVCPIKALLNNIHPRLEHYCKLVGRRCDLWHGDTTDSVRRRIIANPPDILLTTPESLEVLLVHRHRKHPGLLATVRAVVIDEMHAFAGDDRGWHLLSVLERVGSITGDPLQRVGLSATVGNAPELLGWLTCGRGGKAIDASAVSGPTPDVQLDFVGSLENAAAVISMLHAGEKRLVFCDSRARVEQLGRMLREHNVDTYVSHSSLSINERRQAEAAFASRSNCVIVATSTLELGIDVGDLDRVIQIDCPATVASFLQRLGRTGRRPGTQRNCLFLTTSEDALLQAAALIQMWSTGYVEPVLPPPLPLHIFAQQIMAMAIQDGGLPRDMWASRIGQVPGFASAELESLDAVLNHMTASGLISNDHGLLWIGEEGEDTFGRRHFMSLLSSFTSPPLFRVSHGRQEIGLVDQLSFMLRDEGMPVILLSGRSWQVTNLNWEARVAHVVPTDTRGKSRWAGGGPLLTYRLCQAIREVLVSDSVLANWSRRAKDAIATARSESAWARSCRTVVQPAAGGNSCWWTFGGLRVNASLVEGFRQLGIEATADNLRIVVRAEVAVLQDTLVEQVRAASEGLWPQSLAESAAKVLKFSECVPPNEVLNMMRARLSDAAALKKVANEPVVYCA
jgi:ATP-dependent Lhr-like helicase